MTPLWFALAVGLFGLAVGSFLNVCIYRLPRGESIAWPGSHCPACGKPIAWYHNLPLVGYLVLGGRCAKCREPISVRYPIVELVCGLAFFIQAWIIGPEWLLLPRLFLTAALIVLFAIDLEHQILPNAITLLGIVVGLVASVFLPPGVIGALIGVVVGGALPWAIAEAYYRLRRVEGLGMGDVKMLAMIGAFLGWKLTLATLFFASLTGAVVGIALVARGRGSLQLKLPFGTFLAAGAFAASAWGEPFVRWYGNLYP